MSPLQLSLWKPLLIPTPTSRPAKSQSFWLSAPTTDTFQKLLGLPTPNVLRTKRLRLTPFCTGGSLGTGLESVSESQGLDLPNS